MPNYCYYQIKVGGYFGNVDAFIQVLNNDYNKLHMYRVFSANVEEETLYGVYKTALISGECAWSVSACMLNDYDSSYYATDLKRHVDMTPRTHYNFDYKCAFTNGFNTLNNFTGTTLNQLARMYGLDIYVYSCEPMMAFSENIKIARNGTMIKNDCYEYEEIYFGDIDTYDEVLGIYGFDRDTCPFTEEEFKKLKNDGIGYYTKTNSEFDMDAIPPEPNYFTKSIIYKVVDNK